MGRLSGLLVYAYFSVVCSLTPPPSFRLSSNDWKIPIDEPVGISVARVYLSDLTENAPEPNITIGPPSQKFGFLDGYEFFEAIKLASSDISRQTFQIRLSKPLYASVEVGSKMHLSVKVHSGIIITKDVNVEVEGPVHQELSPEDLYTPRPAITIPRMRSSSPPSTETTTQEDEKEPAKESSVLIIVLVPLLIVLPSTALGTYFFRRKFKKVCGCCGPLEKETVKREASALSNQTEQTELQSSRKTSLAAFSSVGESEFMSAKEWISTDPWEIPRHHLKIFGILGEGCFGQVWRAEGVNILGNKGKITVAVKTLKESATEKERADLIAELGVMKMLDTHPNVVKLLGCCTEKDPVFVVMEYVAKGKLQEVLRKSRASQEYGNLHGNSGRLTSRDLTLFCYQVAKGMEYLASKKVIHRDLAARNILVTDENICKVSDFGFSRDVMIKNIYERKSEGRLPIRWMAPEALYDNIYTTKTDVWSFGILMWEIITLGSTPYPGMSGSEVMKRVKEGIRLEKPDHCDREIFNIMYYCWDEEPKERPSFTQLVKDFEDMLLKETDYIDLNQFPDHAYYNEVSLSGEKV